MPRNGSGTSSVINTFVIDTIADPDEVNANFTDVADQLTNSLPRDGQAGMNAPLPLQNGTAALPALTFSSDTDTGFYRASANNIGIALGGTGYPLDAGVVYAAKAGNYTAVAVDNNAVHRYTATATVSLTAAATLGTNWHYTIIADGADVTIDPNASETINGLTTLIVKSGTTAEIICNGTNFFTVLRTTPWEMVGDYAPAAVASLVVTGLSPFRKIRASGFLFPSTATTLICQVSADGGASWQSGASDYSHHLFRSQGTNAFTSGALSSSSLALSAGGNVVASISSGFSFNLDIEAFNKASNSRFIMNGGGDSGSEFTAQSVGRIAVATAWNAIRFLSSSGNISGNIVLEGMRG